MTSPSLSDSTAIKWHNSENVHNQVSSSHTQRSTVYFLWFYPEASGFWATRRRQLSRKLVVTAHSPSSALLSSSHASGQERNWVGGQNALSAATLIKMPPLPTPNACTLSPAAQGGQHRQGKCTQSIRHGRVQITKSA